MGTTINDVAREAGVSISTVSKALNNSHTISGETTIRIKEIARRLNYHPNARAQTFARQMNREVSFLTYLSSNIAFENPHMVQIMFGAEEALYKRGYALRLQGCTMANVCDFASSIIESKSTDGLIIHGSVVTRELALLLNDIEIPHIVIGAPEFRNNLCWIDINHMFAGEIAANYLYESGHKEIAYIGVYDDEDRISAGRLEGIIHRLKEKKMKLDGNRIFKGHSNVDEGTRMTAELLKSPVLPDAIICTNNLLAFGCMRTLKESGIRIPEDISLLTFDDYPLAQITVPKLTAVSIDVHDLGIQAGKLLVSKIKKSQMLVQSYVTMPQLVIRGSTR